uniref:Putative GIY-YIG homing endonuclease n=1 Tax=Lobochlamys segnis TaxID=52035 RepID=A0A0S2IBV4_9CHLO|nr:putative GIY-YIG homing endonuclease [Lobochlamys segnis]
MTQKFELPLFPTRFKSGIYIITCLPLQKYYVGSSLYVVRRINAHKSDLRRGCHHNAELQKDYNFYGLGKFVFQRLLFGVGLEKKELEKLETQILLTLAIQQRYNKYTDWRKRGSATNPFYGKTHSLEARKQQSLANKGKPSSFLGHSQTNEVKKLISQQNTGASAKDRRKPLYIDSIYYESVSEASSQTGLARRLIRKRCHSSEEVYQNYQWAN